ncbi:substrate-binding periplasmic protein [Vibrio ostreicida]|uniref:Transporter substrate-binding domain-containing protein n=1 Tax=Vibrio ostreicida TaxID=526588 RepID=A0ABT8BVH0_9VIBR|nr:transporter substrate-binding domain-containing protein [Vibrio ostreicida]MDN3611130.1 transporter substrate-binding domain-containing protein [Vibrio ostreicida]MDN3611261.1 transporter substrate-binding domain-containing protein [Vibrio ostreicida]MDN3612592.1 transporter substrate-binding domain-containing protein [Vibrio ostreicida]NPD09210.1 transporter substrate-binding domain-containing protein [Vibrio ostreicida]
MKIPLTVMLALVGFNAYAEKITLTTTDWPPLYAEHLPNYGFFAELSRAVFKKAGYDLHIEFVTPWVRALEWAKDGRYDGLLGAYFTQERTQFFYYPDPIYSVNEIFIQKYDNNITYNELNELKPYSIGGMRGGAHLEILQEQGFDIDETTDDLQSLRKLAVGRVELVLMAEHQFHFLMDQHPDLTGKLKTVYPPYKTFNIYTPISKKRKGDNTVLIDKLNAAILALKEDGTFDTLLKSDDDQ